MLSADGDRPCHHHPAGSGRRRAGNRAPARAHVRSWPLCQVRLSPARAHRPPVRPVIHRPHRHAAGRLGAAVADLHRRQQGTVARSADRGAAVPRAWRRPGLDRAGAGASQGQGSPAGGAGRRRALLRQVRLQADPQGPRRAAGPGRSGAAFGVRARRARLRGRVRPDPAGLERGVSTAAAPSCRISAIWSFLGKFLTALIGAASVARRSRAIGVPVKIASTVVIAAVLAATGATAQAMYLARMKCKDFIELPKETVTSLTIWLDGYLTDDEEPRVVDLAQIKIKAEKLSLFCAQNPTVSLLSAAEDVIEK